MMEKEDYFYEEAYDLADSVSDIYGCDETIRKRLTDLLLQAIKYGHEYRKENT